MARGRKPKPEAVRDQTNPVRSTRKPKADAAQAAPVVTVGGVKPPTWLTGEGLAIWNERAPLLSQGKLLTEADTLSFARYCRNFGRWLKNVAVLDGENGETETYTVQTASGIVHRARPEFLIADRLERQLLAAEDRFGLNPAERQRIIAARLNAGGNGDLFGTPAAKREDDPAAKPAPAAKPVMPTGPVGFLN